MITEKQTSTIVIHITDELAERLHPSMAGLGIHVRPHRTRGEQHELRLTMRTEVYEALVERVGSALDYDVRSQPNEYEPDAFVEGVRPLELTNGVLVASGCLQCGAEIDTNRVEAACPYSLAVSFISPACQGGRIQMYPAASCAMVKCCESPDYAM